MGDTLISWTRSPDGSPGKTWNFGRGCRRTAPENSTQSGCGDASGGGCYAERTAARFCGPGQPYEGLIKITANGPRWSGEIRFLPEHLTDPLKWTKPKRIFVDSMSDLFYDRFTDDQISAGFGVMAAAPQHTYMILTKRAERMRNWFATPDLPNKIDNFRRIAAAGRITEFFAPERVIDLADYPGYAVTSKGRVISVKKGYERELKQDLNGDYPRVALYRDGMDDRPLVHRLILETFDGPAKANEQGRHLNGDSTNNALWNLKWGSQSENWDDSKQHGNRRRYSKLTAEQVAELRLLADEGYTGEALGRRFGISGNQARNIIAGNQWKPEHKPEWPLKYVWMGVSTENQAAANERVPLLLDTPAEIRFLSVEPLLGPVTLKQWLGRDKISWVIMGCESGPNSRPAEADWFRSLIDECNEAGVTPFLKQARASDGVTAGPGSRVKPDGVIENPYLDGKQYMGFPDEGKAA